LPICAALLLELVNMNATRLSGFGTARRRANRAAMPATRATRSMTGS
jgi:hypothetical protein